MVPVNSVLLTCVDANKELLANFLFGFISQKPSVTSIYTVTKIYIYIRNREKLIFITGTPQKHY